jgi:hypothetical protein
LNSAPAAFECQTKRWRFAQFRAPRYGASFVTMRSLVHPTAAVTGAASPPVTINLEAFAVSKFYCPVHDVYSAFTCGGECNDQREEFLRIRHALDAYWRQRARGAKPRGQIPAVRFHTRLRKVRRIMAGEALA